MVDLPTTTTTTQEWAGSLTCADATRGVHVVTTVSEVDGGPDQVTATVWYQASPIEPGSEPPPEAEWRTRMRGTIDGGAIDLAADEPPSGAPPFSITRLVGQVAVDGSTLDAFVESPGCTAINLRAR